MWSTAMARNFPSPLCGEMCHATRRRRRHPAFATTRGLLVPPVGMILMSPVYSCINHTTNTRQHNSKNGGAAVQASTPVNASASSSSSSEEIPAQVVVLGDTTGTQQQTQQPLLEIDTSAVLPDDDVELANTANLLVTTPTQQHHHRLLSCVNKVSAMTPRSSSMRRCQRSIPSPPPTPATVSCGSSCSSLSSSKQQHSSSSLAEEEASNHHHHNTKKDVRFGKVEIREHPRILGDNPSVKRGPALSLGWYDNGKELSFDIDTFEAIRAPQRRDNLALSSSVRKKLLLKDAGVTMQDIRKAKLEIAKIKRSRRHHNVCAQYDDTTLVVENCLQTMQGLLTGHLADWELAKLMRQAKLAAEQQQEHHHDS